MMTISRFMTAVIIVLLFQTSALASPLDACPEYIRYGIPSDKGDLLCRIGYALAHNPAHKTPDWVVEHLTRARVNAMLPRSNDFRADPDLEVGQRSELSDYKKSGYDRGHMAPAGDMRWNKDAMSESFLLSNMSPQVGPGFNRNIWKTLEGDVRDWAATRGEVYVYTGPVYTGTPKTIGKDKVAVPSAFYKIIFDPVRVEAIAFILPNKKLKTSDLPNFITTVDDVEARTGLDFLSVIQKNVQNMVESQKASGLW